VIEWWMLKPEITKKHVNAISPLFEKTGMARSGGPKL
jgi:hypothetical protein